MAWRIQAYASDPLATVWPQTFILDNIDINKLSRLHPTEVTDCQRVVSVLNETQEWPARWSEQTYDIIRAYDKELEDLRRKEETQADHCRPCTTPNVLEVTFSWSIGVRMRRTLLLNED